MALSANDAKPLRNTAGMSIYETTIKTSAVVYHHALIGQTAAGKLVACADSTTMTFAGLAIVTNPTTGTAGITGDGTLKAKYVTNVEVQMTLKTSVTVGMVGSVMYAFDDNTITNLTTLGPEVGVLVEFTSANLGWIAIRGEAITKGA